MSTCDFDRCCQNTPAEVVPNPCPPTVPKDTFFSSHPSPIQFNPKLFIPANLTGKAWSLFNLIYLLMREVFSLKGTANLQAQSAQSVANRTDFYGQSHHSGSHCLCPVGFGRWEGSEQEKERKREERHLPASLSSGCAAGRNEVFPPLARDAIMNPLTRQNLSSSPVVPFSAVISSGLEVAAPFLCASWSPGGPLPQSTPLYTAASPNSPPTSLSSAPPGCCQDFSHKCKTLFKKCNELILGVFGIRDQLINSYLKKKESNKKGGLKNFVLLLCHREGKLRP